MDSGSGGVASKMTLASAQWRNVNGAMAKSLIWR
jgi:hypothetical protein